MRPLASRLPLTRSVAYFQLPHSEVTCPSARSLRQLAGSRHVSNNALTKESALMKGSHSYLTLTVCFIGFFMKDYFQPQPATDRLQFQPTTSSRRPALNFQLQPAAATGDLQQATSNRQLKLFVCDWGACGPQTSLLNRGASPPGPPDLNFFE